MNKNQMNWLIVPIVLALIASATSALAPNPAGISSAGRVSSLSTSLYLPIVSNSVEDYDWLQFNGNASHTGNNTLEKNLSPLNVSTLHLLFQATLPAVADGAPVYLSNVPTTSGIHNIIFMTTLTGEIVALDAFTGTKIWEKSNPAGSCLINNNSKRNQACYTTSSPAIDPGRQYAYSYGLDGYVHKYAVGDGAEVLTGGWPELATLKAYDEKGSSALSIATDKAGVSYLYVTNSGYPGDAGNYQGHVTAINLSDGSQKVFNSLCSNLTAHFLDSRVISGPDCYPNVQSGIWARPGVTYDPVTDRLYMATGNGEFNPGLFRWGDSVFALHPDGSGTGNGNPLDSYTPTDFLHLDNADLDLGSTAPALLPAVSSKYPHLAVQGGKDSVLRLINLDNLSGQNQAGMTGGEVFSITVSMGGEILPQPAVWVNPVDQSTWVFVSDDLGIAGVEVLVDGAGNPSLQSQWTGLSGSSPLVADGVLFYARGGLISALDPTSGKLLWSNNQIGGLHWESPIVANGMLYITDENGKLNAYSLP